MRPRGGPRRRADATGDDKPAKNPASLVASQGSVQVTPAGFEPAGYGDSEPAAGVGTHIGTHDASNDPQRAELLSLWRELTAEQRASVLAILRQFVPRRAAAKPRPVAGQPGEPND